MIAEHQPSNHEERKMCRKKHMAERVFSPRCCSFVCMHTKLYHVRQRGVLSFLTKYQPEIDSPSSFTAFTQQACTTAWLQRRDRRRYTWEIDRCKCAADRDVDTLKYGSIHSDRRMAPLKYIFQGLWICFFALFTNILF